MRISTAWSQQLSANAISAQHTQLAKVQLQLSTNLKLTEPADDPAAAVRALKLQKSLDVSKQFQDNISNCKARLNDEGVALVAASEVLAGIRLEVIKAKNSNITPADKLSIQNKVNQAITQLAGIAGTANSNGEFLFSGDQSSTKPFAISTVTNNYVYQGGQNQRSLQVSPTRLITDGDLGLAVFENIKSVSPNKDENGNRSIFNTLQALSNALGGTFAATAGVITGGRFLQYGATFPAAPPTQFTLTANPGAVAVPIDLSGQTFANVGAMVTQINTQIAGAGAAGSIQARSNGSRIEFASVVTGATSSIQITNTSGTFLNVAGFTNLQTNAGANAPTVYATELNDVITDIDAATANILQVNSNVGVRINALDDQRDQNVQATLNTQKTLSETQDLDYAEASVRLQSLTSALQAAQLAFSKVKDISLFNYL